MQKEITQTQYNVKDKAIRGLRRNARNSFLVIRLNINLDFFYSITIKMSSVYKIY